MIILLEAKDGEALHSQQKQDWELTVAQIMYSIAKFILKLKKVGKTTRPFRYDINQIPDDYTVEVTNRFKGLDLIDRVPEELWMEIHNTVQEEVIKTIPKKKEGKVTEESFQITEERREVEGKGGKERYTQVNAEF